MKIWKLTFVCAKSTAAVNDEWIPYSFCKSSTKSMVDCLEKILSLNITANIPMVISNENVSINKNVYYKVIKNLKIFFIFNSSVENKQRKQLTMNNKHRLFSIAVKQPHKAIKNVNVPRKTRIHASNCKRAKLFLGAKNNKNNDANSSCTR